MDPAASARVLPGPRDRAPARGREPARSTRRAAACGWTMARTCRTTPCSSLPAPHRPAWTPRSSAARRRCTTFARWPTAGASWPLPAKAAARSWSAPASSGSRSRRRCVRGRWRCMWSRRMPGRSSGCWGPELGDLIRRLHEEQGVVFHLGQKPRAVEGGSVILESGERLAADLFVAGIGVRPNLDAGRGGRARARPRPGGRRAARDQRAGQSSPRATSRAGPIRIRASASGSSTGSSRNGRGRPPRAISLD